MHGNAIGHLGRPLEGLRLVVPMHHEIEPVAAGRLVHGVMKCLLGRIEVPDAQMFHPASRDFSVFQVPSLHDPFGCGHVAARANFLLHPLRSFAHKLRHLPGADKGLKLLQLSRRARWLRAGRCLKSGRPRVLHKNGQIHGGGPGVREGLLAVRVRRPSPQKICHSQAPPRQEKSSGRPAPVRETDNDRRSHYPSFATFPAAKLAIWRTAFTASIHQSVLSPFVRRQPHSARRLIDDSGGIADRHNGVAPFIVYELEFLPRAAMVGASTQHEVVISVIAQARLASFAKGEQRPGLGGDERRNTICKVSILTTDKDIDLLERLGRWQRSRPSTNPGPPTTSSSSSSDTSARNRKRDTQCFTLVLRYP